MADNGGVKLSQPWEVSNTSGQADAIKWTIKGRLNVQGKLYLYDAARNTFQEVKLYDDGTRRLLYVDR